MHSLEKENRFANVNSIVFDLDGTLIDSTPGISAALSLAFQAAGRTMPECDLCRFIGPPITIIARRVEPSLTDNEVNVIEHAYRSAYDTDGWRSTVAYPEVLDSVHSLHRGGLALFIVTNKPALPTSRILAHLGLSGVFTEQVSRDSQNPPYSGKSAMLADLMLRQRLDPGATLMIGDTSEDQEAAHRNNIEFIHVTYGYGTLSVPSLTCVAGFAEIPQLLFRTRIPAKDSATA